MNRLTCLLIVLECALSAVVLRGQESTPLPEAAPVANDTAPLLANGSDQTEAIRARIQALGKVGVLELPKGVIGVSAQLLTIEPGRRITLRGAGMGQTLVKLLNDLPGPLVEVKGGKGKMCSYFAVENLTFMGDGKTADCFRCEGLMWANFTRVEVRGFRGHAVHGLEFWDSVFSDCHFVDCGDVARNRAAVQLDTLDGADYFTSSNNITFLGCRWESNPYISLRVGPGSRKMRLVSCKFHGTLPTAQPYDHVVFDGADANVITATNFSNGGKSAIVLSKAHGNVLTENLIGSNPEYGVHLIDAHSNIVAHNSFAATNREQPNVKGAWQEDGECKANEFETNVGTARTTAGEGEEQPVGRVIAGSGNPEGKVSGEPGTVYLNTLSGATVKVYIKQGGPGKNGWKPLK
jgi:parallel beta-helix repeat protein